MTLDWRNESERSLPDDLMTDLERCVAEVLRQEGVETACEISFLFVDSDHIRQLNASHRGKDSVTDVLSFPQFEGLSEIRDIQGICYLGDVVICVERAEAQAEAYGHALKRELSYLTVHSVLHLLGYDHMTDSDQRRMRAAEKSVLKALGIFKKTTEGEDSL